MWLLFLISPWSHKNLVLYFNIIFYHDVYTGYIIPRLAENCWNKMGFTFLIPSITNKSSLTASPSSWNLYWYSNTPTKRISLITTLVFISILICLSSSFSEDCVGSRRYGPPVRTRPNREKSKEEKEKKIFLFPSIYDVYYVFNKIF